MIDGADDADTGGSVGNVTAGTVSSPPVKIVTIMSNFVWHNELMTELHALQNIE